MASAARELVIQRLGLVRSLCESEEQRLLEQVHGEEERAHQSILTQRVHWAEALQKLDSIRGSLVDMLTHLDDLQLIVSQAGVRTPQVDQIPPKSENENVLLVGGGWKMIIWNQDETGQYNYMGIFCLFLQLVTVLSVVSKYLLSA